MSGGRANPYPGTRAFEAEDSGRFFGRATEIRQLRDLAVARRVVLLYAASGAGKTSLLTAGLVPHLRQTLPMARIFPIARVSGDPPAGLEVADVHVWNVSSAILEEVTEGAGPAEIAGLTLCQGLDKLLTGQAPEEGPPPAFLILDQLEELFQDGRGDPRIFFLQLREALEARPELSLILALREDALAQLDPYKILLPDQLRTRFRLDLLGPEAALCAIEGPAEDAGIPFAPGAARQLVDDLRRSLAESPEGTTQEALGAWVDPVQLQVVCHRIWVSLPDEATEIDETRAHAVGSFDEILARHYDERLRDVEREAGVPEKALRRWIDQLITPQGMRSQVPQEPGVTRGLDNRAVKALVDTHLVRAERRRGMVWYELGHDRMVRPVQQSNHAWRENNRSLLERQASLWVAEGKPRRRLLRGRELAAAKQRLAADREEATAAAQEFLEACRRARRRRIRIRVAGLGALLVIVATLGGFGMALWELGLSGASSILLNLDNEILRHRDSDLDLALLLGVSALESQKNLSHMAELGILDTDTRRLLFQALEASPHLEAFLPVANGEVSGVAFSPDGRTLTATTTAGSVESWEVATRRRLSAPDESPLRAGPEPPPALTVTVTGPRGGTVITGHPDGTLLFQHQGGARPLPRDGGVGPVARLAVSPDGEVLAAGGSTGRIALWDLRHEQPLAGLTGKTAPLHGLTFSPDSTWLASGHGRSVVLWRRNPRLRLGREEETPDPTAAVPTPAEPLEGVCPGDAASLASVSDSDGILTVAGCPDGTVVFSLRFDETRTLRRMLALQPLPVQALALAQDGGSLAAATSDGAVWVVDLTTKERVFAGPLRGHRGPIAALAFEDPAGRQLLSVGTDGRRIHWDLDPASWRKIACGIAGRNLTEEERTRLPYSFLITPATCIQETP